MRVKIYASLSEDSMEGWVWLSDKSSSQNGYILIKCVETQKSIICFRRTIDENYLKQYDKGMTTKIGTDEKAMCINSYYRSLLKIQTGQEYDLMFSKCNQFELFFKSGINHPNPYISYGNRVTIFSFIIGVLGLLLAIVALFKSG